MRLCVKKRRIAGTHVIHVLTSSANWYLGNFFSFRKITVEWRFAEFLAAESKGGLFDMFEVDLPV